MSSPRWVIEERKNDNWEPAGWVDAPSASSAVAIASAQWPDVAGLKLRAILWAQATLDQQGAAEYERNLRIRLRETSGAPGSFADQWAKGELPFEINTPTKAAQYQQANTARRGIGIAVATVVIGLLLAIFAKPSLPTLFAATAVGISGFASSYSRARKGLLEPGNELAATKTPFSATALVLPGSLVIALMQQSWVAALSYVVAFFLGVLVGIIASELLVPKNG